MTTFVTVIQVSAAKFDVFKFNGHLQKALYPQTSKYGVLISCWESNEQNDMYCFDLAEKLNKAEA